MKQTSEQQPLILIDLIKPRIRIHKSTLHLIENPEYIYLLVNPKFRLIGIKAATRSDPRSHHISCSAIHHKASFEIYSAPLLETLYLCSGWTRPNKYRIYGRFISEYDMVQFKIDDAYIYNHIEKNAGGRNRNAEDCERIVY